MDRTPRWGRVTRRRIGRLASPHRLPACTATESGRPAWPPPPWSARPFGINRPVARMRPALVHRPPEHGDCVGEVALEDAKSLPWMTARLAGDVAVTVAVRWPPPSSAIFAEEVARAELERPLAALGGRGPRDQYEQAVRRRTFLDEPSARLDGAELGQGGHGPCSSSDNDANTSIPAQAARRSVSHDNLYARSSADRAPSCDGGGHWFESSRACSRSQFHADVAQQAEHRVASPGRPVRSGPSALALRGVREVRRAPTSSVRVRDLAGLFVAGRPRSGLSGEADRGGGLGTGRFPQSRAERSGYRGHQPVRVRRLGCAPRP